MKQRIYSILDEKKILIQENSFNMDGKIIHSIDFSVHPNVEEFFEYNGEGLLIREFEIQEGVENSSQVFEYDNENEVVDEKLFISGELYEQTIITKTENSFTKIMVQDGVEVERLEKIKEGKNWTNNFFQNNELLERQEYRYNSKDNSGELTIHIFEDDTRFSVKENYNKNDDIILKEEFNENGSILISTETEYENGLVVKEIIEDFSNTEGKYQNIYKYDDNANMVLFECLSSTGALNSFHRWRFDLQNRLVEESSYSNGFYSGITGVHSNHDRSHIVYEYE